MANQNRQWALPSKPAGIRSPKRFSKSKGITDKNSPIQSGSTDSPTFHAARAMFESKPRPNTKLPSPPKKRRSAPNVIKSVHNPDNISKQPPPSMAGGGSGYPHHNASNTWSAPYNREHTDLMDSNLPQIPEIEDTKHKQHNSYTNTPPPTMKGHNIYQTITNLEEKAPPNQQRYMTQNRGRAIPQQTYPNRSNNQYMNNQYMQYNRGNTHNRVNSGNSHHSHHSSPRSHHSRSSTNNLGQNIQWNYSGNKQDNEIQTEEKTNNTATLKNATTTDDEYWYYVDPFEMKVSEKPVNKYVLKGMFVNQHINENCLIWNELYSDYVTIGDVPHLLNFFYDDASQHNEIKSVLNKDNNQAIIQKGTLTKPTDDNDEDPNNWKQCYTADGKVYYKNLVNQQIVWTKPRALRGSVMKILLNDESIRNIKKDTGTCVPKKRVNKREQKEINSFEENVGDVRWIPHSRDGFVIARFVKRDGKYSIYQPFDDSELFAMPQVQSKEKSNKDKKKRKPIKIPTLKVLHGGLSITNWDYMDKNVADMVKLPDLSAPYVLHNLKHRFLHHQIYTQVGQIMISINPYQLLPLYLPSVLERYKFGRTGAPHIYDIARAAYYNIISRRRAQTIIISGESGSGKTECTKQILQFMAECAGNDNKIEQKLLSTNPILESFGNCLTVRNNNSSRFGKYIEIYFSDNQIQKSFQNIYLLEKVRVCKKSKEERNYHIFYQLIACDDVQLKKSLKLGRVSNYAYLQGVEVAPGIEDGEDFIHLNKAFKDIGCFADDAHANTVFNIYKLCSGILWLGNILFEGAKKKSNDFKGDWCVISERSQNAVKIVCTLFEIDSPNLLMDALMYKSMIVSNEPPTKIGLSINKAYENRDALAKFLYNELFNWIVNKLNEHLIDTQLKQSNNIVSIGVLDIFGFEILKKNSFEQLCINYTNERLQHLFDETVFRNEDKLYESQGIKVLMHEKFNNLPIIELVDHKKNGIFSVLDSQCSVPQSDDNTFTTILNQLHSQNGGTVKIYEKFPKKPNNFIIHHYAGKVQYDARGFMNKNRDNLNMDLVNLLDKSHNELIRTVIEALKTKMRINQQRRQTLSQSYRESLDVLMNKLSSAQIESHYIRCIKPNDTKQQNCWMGKLVLDQLTYSGVFEAIKIKKNGYPFRGYHREFIDRFVVILDDDHVRDKAKGSDTTLVEAVELISSHLLREHGDNHQFMIGESMVFYQHKEHETMERQRDLAFRGSVELIQSYVRMRSDRVQFEAMLAIKPKLESAINYRNISLLNSAISDAICITFPMRLIMEAKNLRTLLDRHRECESQLQYVMNDARNITSEYVQDLSRAIAQCESCGYYSDVVSAAKQRLEEYTSHNKIRLGLKRGCAAFDISEIKRYLDMAKLLDINDDELIMEANRLVSVITLECSLLDALRDSFTRGGYYGVSCDVIDYSVALSLSVDEMTDCVTKCHECGIQTESGKSMMGRARHLLQLRIALKKALMARNDDSLWNIVVNVINNSILRQDASMASNIEICAANNLIYVYFRDNFSDKFAAELRRGCDEMDYGLIKSCLTTHASGKTQYSLHSKYNSLLSSGRELVAQMESINNYLTEGLRDHNMNLLSIGLNRADDIGYRTHDLFRAAQSFYSKYGTFDVRLNRAIYEFDIDAMKLLLEESESYRNKRADPKIMQIANLIYNTPFDKLLQLQLNAAVSARDPQKVCKITLKLKKLFFEKNAHKFSWKCYPKLLSPESWAKQGGLFASKSKLKRTFYVWSNNPIHHSLTDLSSGTGAIKNHDVAYLKKCAMEMFKNILGIMGDRHYQQPLSLIQDVLVKISDRIHLRNEFYAQCIKQLTQNPSRDSRIKGWNLLTVILDTLKPPKDIENYLEKWLRDNEPENMNDDSDREFYVRLLHQTIFLGSRTKIPTLNQINDLLINKNVRTLNTTHNNKQSQSAYQHQHPQPMYHYHSQNQNNIVNNQQQQQHPPELTSIHEGKLQQQRIALEWNRTITTNNHEAQVYYCGYTMDDETRDGNNWHYAPHAPTNANKQQQQAPMQPPHHHYHHYNQQQQQQQQPGAAIPYSVTDQVREYGVLDL